jgi:hypothetical protein
MRFSLSDLEAVVVRQIESKVGNPQEQTKRVHEQMAIHSYLNSEQFLGIQDDIVDEVATSL